MSNLAYGPGTWHVLASKGSPIYPLHFYSTTYSVTHGRDSHHHPGAPLLRHKGTGYASNFHPAVHYSSKLDQIDNPVMGDLLKDNYKSHTKKEYVRYRLPQGSDPFPRKIHSFSSGFAHNFPRTLPAYREVRQVHFDTNTTVPVSPHTSPLITSRALSDPVASENACRGPKAMSTEYTSRFQRQQFRATAIESSKHSNKEESGFTHSATIEPVTFRPSENHAGDLPGHITWRPTGSSVMKSSFKHSLHAPKEGEPVHTISTKADCSNGFVKGNKAMADVQPAAAEMVGFTTASQVHPCVLERVRKQDPAEHSVLTHPYQYTSLTQRSYGQGGSPSKAQQLCREAVGSKELTGFSENNSPFVIPKANDTERFSTHYQHTFSDPSPIGEDREGHIATGRGVQTPVQNGFWKGTAVHHYGSSLDTAKTLRELDPYVARSVLKRDPYFDDHTYDQKIKKH